MRAFLGRADAILRWTMIGVVVALAVHGTLAIRGVYADGAYYLYQMLINQGFFLFDPSRLFAQFLTQVPAAYAIQAGIDDLGVLAVVHSVGVVGIPTLLWGAALVLLIRHRLFWPMAVTFAVVFLGSGFITIGEYNLLYGLVALTVALLVRPRITTPGLVALVAAAVVMLRSYEASAYFGVALAVLVALRWRDDRRAGTPHTVRYAVLAALYLGGAVLGAISIVFPRDPANRSGAADLLSALTIDRQFTTSLVLAVLLVLAAGFLRGRLLVLASVILALGTLVYLQPSVWALPWMHYNVRTVAGLAMVVLLVIAIVAARRTAAEPPSWVFVPAVVLVVMQVLPFTLSTAGYRNWVGVFDTVLAEREGLVPFEDTPLVPEAFRYSWTWTNPFLSAVRRPTGSDTIILNPGAPADAPPPELVPLPPRFHR